MTISNLVINAHTSSFTIDNVQFSDGGSYGVVATNEVASLPGVESPVWNVSVVIDSDGDGLTDEYEGMIGTDPFDPSDPLWVRSIAYEGGVVELSFWGVTNRTYTVLYSGSVNGPWIRLEDVPERTTNGVVRISDPNPAGMRFYRLMMPGESGRDFSP